MESSDMHEKRENIKSYFPQEEISKNIQQNDTRNHTQQLLCKKSQEC